MSIIDSIQQLPPFVRYLTYATALAIFGFVLQSLMPKKQAKQFEPSLLLRYLALGCIVAGAVYLVYYHRDVLHV